MPTQRGTSWQGVVYHQSLPGGRARRNFDAKDEATAWELDSRARLIRGEPVLMTEGTQHAQARKTGLPYTIRELIQHVESTRWAARTSGARQGDNARSLATFIGLDRPVADLTKAEIDKARGKLLQAGNQPATVNRKVAAISTCLSEAVDMGLIAAKPKCAKYRESEHRIRRFTPDEEAEAFRYFEAMGEPDMADFIALSLDTGLRQGEMLALKYRDADGVRVTVWGTGAKSGKTRSVPLTARARGILASRKTRLDAKAADLVFDFNRYALSWQWEKLAKALGLEDDGQFVPHILRHEFCSRLADKDLNAPVIQQLAGHSSLSVTQRYIHVRAEHLVRAIRALENSTETNL